MLLACDPTTTDPTSGPSTDTTTEPPTTSEVELDKLETPILLLNDTRTGLMWNEVENAVGYLLKVNDVAQDDNLEHDFISDEGDYQVTVIALGDNLNYQDSDESLPFDYQTKGIFLSDLERNNMTISWTDISYLTEVKFDENDYVATTSKSFVAPKTGLVKVRVSGGYDEQENINYVGEPIEKFKNVVEVATEKYILEDVEGKTNSDIQEVWSASKYDNGWYDTTGVASVSYEAHGENNNQSLKLDCWKNTQSFRYSIDFDTDYSYNALSMLVKGDDDITYTIRLHNIETGVYADYKIQHASSNWTHHLLRFDDPDWAVYYGGNVYSLMQVAEVLGFDHPGELISVFDQFQIIVKGTYIEGGPKLYCLIDEMAFVNDDSPVSKKEAFYNIEGRYTGELNGTVFYFENDGETGVVKTLNLPDNVYLPVIVETDFETLTLTSIDDGESLVYQGRISHYGDRITYLVARGLFASHVANLVVSKVKVLDDFESYTETGVGYDLNNPATNRRGLRGSYYVDYYTGNSSHTSPVGGTGWSLVSSTDYLNLIENDAHSGTKSAELKRSSPIRYLNYASYTGVNPGYGAGNSKFSFWAKPITNDVTFRIRVYYVPKVDPSNQVSGGTVSATADVLVQAGMGWQQVMIDINPARVVFGYSITTNGGSASKPLVDDIELFSANPWV